MDKKRKIITIGSKQYRVDLQNESLTYMNSGVKIKSNAPEMSRFKKLLDANKKDDKEKMPKISLSIKDFKKFDSDIETENPKALQLHDYKASEIEYYEDGKKKKAIPFITEFYSSNAQNKLGGYEAYFDRADSIGTFKTLDEAIKTLNSWINKMRVPNHPEPKWIYSQRKGDYQMNYEL